MTFDSKNNQFVQYDRNNHQLLFYTNPAFGSFDSTKHAIDGDSDCDEPNKPFVLYLLEVLLLINISCILK